MRAQLEPVCGICGGPIDLSLPAGHKESWTLDHIIPLAQGGDPESPYNVRPAHMRCNSARGAGSRAVRATRGSRAW
ncbi:HNH endonuclease [Rhodococcus sp. 11-3]|uniref:HNH endonuclease n=1 Tax=Rhodococcus sp. 11-3 TaxID=2854796 RepID=UPI00204254E2|nr:HNH endonuclease signature motif containing protein [Rhodococcus sp. 11-3]USC18124.1 HNH endonuclease [Rhodococcus sp. 11-3]